MLPTAVLEQTQRLRFTDPSIEADYLAERSGRDAVQTRRVMLTTGIATAVLGLVILGVSPRDKLPVPGLWAALRFGVMVPTFLLTWFAAGRSWGKANLQVILGVCIALAGAAFTLEWDYQWTLAMPVRVLWFIPAISIWAIVMSLPMNVRSALIAVAGAYGMATLGIVQFLPLLSWPIVAGTTVAYVILGSALILIVRWRETRWRIQFAYQRESEQLAAQIKSQFDTLQKLIEQRNEFVAGVLHDLRSPLTTVLLSTEILRTAGDLPAEARHKMYGDIESAAKRVKSFANRFLEQHALDSAVSAPRLADLPLGPIVARAVAHAALGAASKGQRVALEAGPANPTVVVDELLLDRALGNLLDNAVKYSPHGALITVRVTLEEPARARVAVTDAGPGLSAAEQARLYQPYVMLGTQPTGGETSSGLGLSLVKHCIEGMGGTVGCESELGHGATFWLALKCAQALGVRPI